MKVVLLLALVSAFCNAYSVNEEDLNAVKFYLYTRNVTREDHRACLKDVKSSSFDPSLPTYFTCHGWKGSDKEGKTSAMKNVKDALLEQEACNVFNLDWNYWAANLNLKIAASFTQRVGQITAEFIKLLETEFSVSRENMHIIGFSLGGQVVSHVGASLQSPKVGRITGLDSAGVGCTTATTCLDPSDGTFVQEIHTAVSVKPKGHADFWPQHVFGSGYMNGLPASKHSMAPWYFAEGIRAGRCSFVGTLCNSLQDYQNGSCEGNPTNRLGFFAEKPATGTHNNYYLKADWRQPCPPSDVFG